MHMNSTGGFNHELLFSETMNPPPGLFFRLTAGFRILPDFFIIGVQKGGTNSLYHYLTRHPQIIPAQRKEIYFFNNENNFEKGLAWYRKHFALNSRRKKQEKKNNCRAFTLDATTNYFENTEAAIRLKKTFPDAKAILLLRNPVERAWSHYKMSVQYGFEKLGFEEALAVEDERLKNASQYKGANPKHDYVFQRLAYRTKGIYMNYLPAWQEKFGKDLLVLRSEDFFSDEAIVYGNVLQFLGLKDFRPPAFETVNAGTNEQMKAETRKMLQEFYEPHNGELKKFTGRDFNW